MTKNEKIRVHYKNWNIVYSNINKKVTRKLQRDVAIKIKTIRSDLSISDSIYEIEQILLKEITH